MKRIIIYGLFILPYIILAYLYVTKDTYAYKRCISINHEVPIKEILLKKELNLLEEANLSREEIIDVAKERKQQNQEQFCQELIK